MNLGLGTLHDLKSHILDRQAQEQTDYDELLQRIGKAVAGDFEGRCDRKFGRLASDTCEFSADRTYHIVPRYPLESVLLVEIRYSVGEGWEEIAGTDFNIRSASGRIEFGYLLGSYLELIRLTYTGGYFFETLEPDDVGYPTAVPAGSVAIPDDLKLAWLNQSKFVFERRDKLGMSTINNEGGSVSLAGGVLKPLTVLPEVEEILVRYRRYAHP
jgi:hypothetical protein